MTNTAFHVHLNPAAEQDLEELHNYICEHNGHKQADALLDNILEIAQSLKEHPERGSYPKELIKLGITDYRQVFCNTYRVIYRTFINEKLVLIYLIVDGRRDMQSVLERRLLR